MNRAHFAASMQFSMRLNWVKSKNLRYGAKLKSYPERMAAIFQNGRSEKPASICKLVKSASNA